MTCVNIFETEGDGSQDGGTLYSLADEFLEASVVLQNTPPIRVNYSSANYYLLGHSAELMLKAFLYRHGVTIPELRKIGHDLEKLVTVSEEKGLPKTVSLNQIRQLAEIYRNKSLEYRERKKKTFPDIDLLTKEIEALQSAVFGKICRF